VLFQGELWFFPPIISDPNFDYDLLFDYLSLKLNEQYGKGASENVWKNAPRSEARSLLVYAGELVRKTAWSTSTTEIRLVQERAEHLGSVIIKTTVAYDQKRLGLGEALDILFAYPEVAELSERLSEAGARFGVMYLNGDSFDEDFVTEDTHYAFRVYESLETHIVTYNFYNVSATTGEVTLEF